jgi:hypothetical protein
MLKLFDNQSPMWCIIKQPESLIGQLILGDRPIVLVFESNPVPDRFVFLALPHDNKILVPGRRSLYCYLTDPKKRYIVEQETFIFVLSRNFADWVGNVLNSFHHPIRIFSGGLEQVSMQTLHAHPVRALLAILCWDRLPSDCPIIRTFKCGTVVNPRGMLQIFFVLNLEIPSPVIAFILNIPVLHGEV